MTTERGATSKRIQQILHEPRVARVIVVSSVVSGVFLFLSLARHTGIIDPRLFDLLDEPLTVGAGNTSLFSAAIIPLGLLLGFVVGWARVSRHPFLSWPAGAYVYFIRGIPALVLILFAFFWLPLLFRSPDTFEAGLRFAILALVIHTSAYQAEIFRAGFQSVARGQIEAAESLGMRRDQAMRYVVLPQTFRVTLPALGNEFALVIKDTSLLAAVGAAELVYWGRNSAQHALLEFGIIEWVFTTWIIIALVYFVITYVVTQIVAAVEHAYRVPGLGAVAF